MVVEKPHIEVVFERLLVVARETTWAWDVEIRIKMGNIHQYTIPFLFYTTSDKGLNGRRLAHLGDPKQPHDDAGRICGFVDVDLLEY